MKPVRSRLGRLVPILLIVLASVFARAKAGAPAVTPVPTPSPSSGAAVASEPAKPGVAADMAGSTGLDLATIADSRHREQIVRVVDSMDRDGAPPEGVAQGGRRGAKKGVFLNAEGRLPRKAAGYWIESDVWAKNGARDAERLIFGRKREVYWTRDHYETFIRLR